MKIRDWANVSFTIDSKIAWPCPNCQNSSLEIIKDKLFFDESSESKADHDHEAWEIEWVRLTFSGVLNCKSCNEFVAISGIGTIKDFEYYDQFTGEYDRERCEVFTPVFFYPPLPIFKIPEKCPQLLKRLVAVL